MMEASHHHVPATRICGALGRFDPDRLDRIAARLGGELRQAHRDPTSMLLVDGDLVAWRGRREHGVAFSENVPNGARPQTWLEASTALDAGGLVIRGRRRGIHASVAGMRGIYWMDEGEATYFASRIDALADTSGRPLHPDWEAWASILRLGYAVGTHTPFFEIRRLEHSALLERIGSGGSVSAPTWPWSLVEPTTAGDSSAALDAALDDLAGRLRRHPVHVTLSGGADSRLLFLALNRRRPKALSAWTFESVWGREDDAAFATRAAAEAGVRHVVVGVERDRYADDFEAVCEWSDYQQALEWPWLVTLARRMNRLEGIAVDGLAGDILMRGKHGSAALAHAAPAERLATVWDAIGRGRDTRDALRPRIARAINSSARTQLDREFEPAIDHPAGATLGLFKTRTRGMGLGALSVMHSALPTVTPYATDAIARAVLMCPPEQKPGGRYQHQVISAVSPELAHLPVDSYGHTPWPRTVPMRRHAGDAVARRLELLADSPLRPWFNRTLRDAVDSMQPGALAPLRRQTRLLNAITMLTLWERRYRDRLAACDPRDLLG